MIQLIHLRQLISIETAEVELILSLTGGGRCLGFLLLIPEE